MQEDECRLHRFMVLFFGTAHKTGRHGRFPYRPSAATGLEPVTGWPGCVGQTRSPGLPIPAATTNMSPAVIYLAASAFAKDYPGFARKAQRVAPYRFGDATSEYQDGGARYPRRYKGRRRGYDRMVFHPTSADQSNHWHRSGHHRFAGCPQLQALQIFFDAA